MEFDSLVQRVDEIVCAAKRTSQEPAFESAKIAAPMFSMPEEDRPIAASEELVRAAAKEELPAARATISTNDQEIGPALICCDRERARYAASPRWYHPHFGLDPCNLASDIGHCGGEADVAP